MSKVVGIFLKFWQFLTIPAHKKWSYHVTKEANFDIFLFCPNSTFIIRKRHKISSGKGLSASEVISQEPHRGGGG